MKKNVSNVSILLEGPIIEIVKSPRSAKGEPGRTSMITFKPDKLLNCTYLTEPDGQGQRYRAKIVQKIIGNETHYKIDLSMSSFWFL